MRAPLCTWAPWVGVHRNWLKTPTGVAQVLKPLRNALQKSTSQENGMYVCISRPHCIAPKGAKYSAEDKEGDPRFKEFLDAPGKTKTITR
jgi:hypothetical protein